MVALLKEQLAQALVKEASSHNPIQEDMCLHKENSPSIAGSVDFLQLSNLV
jgi:hypothetical protein